MENKNTSPSSHICEVCDEEFICKAGMRDLLAGNNKLVCKCTKYVYKDKKFFLCGWGCWLLFVGKKLHDDEGKLDLDKNGDIKEVSNS